MRDQIHWKLIGYALSIYRKQNTNARITFPEQRNHRNEVATSMAPLGVFYLRIDEVVMSDINFIISQTLVLLVPHCRFDSFFIFSFRAWVFLSSLVSTLSESSSIILHGYLFGLTRMARITILGSGQISNSAVKPRICHKRLPNDLLITLELSDQPRLPYYRETTKSQ